jgi:pimeloyl-ACP methyl ester carboxylesterase
VISPGRLVEVDDTALYVVERGDGPAILALHGGPGLDHREFGDYLDPLTDRYRLVLVDQRGQGRSQRSDPSTWTLECFAADVTALAAALSLDRHAVLGHSFGAFVALQQAVDQPDAARATIVSGGVASTRFLRGVDEALEAFEPVDLRAQVAEAWAREAEVGTPADFATLWRDQLPFHFADPLDPRIADYEVRSAGAAYAPDVLRHFEAIDYGPIEVEDRLGDVAGPMLVIAGRHERTCPLAAAEAIAAGVPGAELVVLEHSAHMGFVEEPEAYVGAVRTFLDAVLAAR